mgnify:CR=1 FL=1
MRYQITKDDGTTWIDLEPFGENEFEYKFELGEIGNIDGLSNPSLFTDILPYSNINITALEYNINSSQVFSRDTFRYRITRSGATVSEGELYIESVEFNNNTPVFRVQFRDYISLVIEKMKSGELTWSDMYTETLYTNNFYFKDTLTQFPYGSDIQIPYQDMLGDDRAGLVDKRFVLAPKVTKGSATPMPWVDVTDFISRVFAASGYGISADSPILDSKFNDLALGVPAQLIVTETTSDSAATYVSNREMDLTPFHSVVYKSKDITLSAGANNSLSKALGGNSNYFQRTDDNNDTSGVYDNARATNYKNGMTTDGETDEGYNISTLHKRGLTNADQNQKFPVVPRSHINRPFARGGYEAVVGGFDGIATLGTTDSTGTYIELDLELFNLDIEGTGATSDSLGTGQLEAVNMTTIDFDLDAMDSAGTVFRFYTEIYEGEYPVQRVYWNSDGYLPSGKKLSGDGVKDAYGTLVSPVKITNNALNFQITLDGQATDSFYITGMTQYRVSIGCEIDGPIIAKGITNILGSSNYATVQQSGSAWIRDCGQVKSRIKIFNDSNANYVERVGVKITPEGPYRASTPFDKTNVIESLDLSEITPYDAFQEIARRFRLSFILDNTNPATPYFLVGRIDDIISNLGNPSKLLEEIADNRYPINVSRGIQSIANIKITNDKNDLKYDESGRDPNLTVGSYEGPIYSYSGGVIQDPLSGNGELELELDGALFRYDLSSNKDNPTKLRPDLNFDTYETYTSDRINPEVDEIGMRFAFLNQNTSDTIGTWFAQYHTFWVTETVNGNPLVYAKVLPQYKLYNKGTTVAKYVYNSYITQTKTGGIELRVTFPAALSGKPSGFYDYVVNSILLQRNAAPTVTCRILLPQSESSQMDFALREYTSQNIHGSLFLVSLDGTNYEDGLYADATFVVLDL